MPYLEESYDVVVVGAGHAGARFQIECAAQFDDLAGIVLDHFVTARDAGAALSPTGVGFVEAGVLAQHATGDTAERINLRLELGHGIVLHVVRG